MNEAMAANPTLASEIPIPGRTDSSAISGRSSGSVEGRCGSGSRIATSAPRKGQMAEKTQTAS